MSGNVLCLMIHVNISLQGKEPKLSTKFICRGVLRVGAQKESLIPEALSSTTSCVDESDCSCGF